MEESPAPSDTAASPRSPNGSRPTGGRGRADNLGSAAASTTLTDLSSMEVFAHTIRRWGRMDPATDRRLAAVIAELESLIHDVLHDAERSRSGAAPSRGGSGSSDAVAGAGARPAEAAFRAWLTSPGKPDLVQVGAAGQPGSLTEILRELVVSQRELPADATQELGMRPGTTLGYAAAELLRAVNDPAGPRCRSYRSAVYYLRDRGNMVFG